MTVQARRATGLLGVFSEAGVLSAADVHVAQRLGALAGESDQQVLLALALVVRGTRQGSVVLDLANAAQTVTPDELEVDTVLPWPEAEQWVQRCASSPLVTGLPQGQPVRAVGTRLWLDRYWRQEHQVAGDLLTLAAGTPLDLDLGVLAGALAELFPGAESDDQRLAAAVASLSQVSVIAGGPGTGKTTTVARLLALLLRQPGPPPRIALAAPTGKAAARLEEAVHSAGLPTADAQALARLHASTLHRLLGWRPGVRSRFRHDRSNHLPYDVVVVDEASMVPLTLMARLLEALPPTARLVLVGDPDQLASVEAGAVLSDIVDPAGSGVLAPLGEALAQVVPGQVPARREPGRGAGLAQSVVVLRTVHRFAEGGEIAALAGAVRDGHARDALDVLRSGSPAVRFDEVPDDAPVAGAVLDRLRRRVLAAEGALVDAGRDGQVALALEALESHRLLCAHRTGPRGEQTWSARVQEWLQAERGIAVRRDGRYAGQPLLVTANDYESGLYNGDTGVLVASGEDLVAVFRRGGQPFEVRVTRLADVRPMHAMTVHRAQGSQFAEVTVLLPQATSPLATRETLYTAVTRASSVVHVIGSAESVVAAVERPVARATGLRERLA